eukprot:g3215.t1
MAKTSLMKYGGTGAVGTLALTMMGAPLSGAIVGSALVCGGVRYASDGSKTWMDADFRGPMLLIGAVVLMYYFYYAYGLTVEKTLEAVTSTIYLLRFLAPYLLVFTVIGFPTVAIYTGVKTAQSDAARIKAMWVSVVYMLGAFAAIMVLHYLNFFPEAV